MKFYTIGPSRELSEIGYYPQAEKYPQYDWVGVHADNKVRIDVFPDFDPELIIELHEKANRTDLIDRNAILSFGIIVSEKLKTLLSGYKLPPHRFYPAKLLHNGETFTYYWFHFYDDLYAYADMEASTVEIHSQTSLELLATLSVHSKEFIKKKQETNGFQKAMRMKDLVFNDTFPGYDVIVNNILGHANLVSEKLHDAIIENKITGVAMKPYDVIK